MAAWLSELLIALLTRLASWLYAKGLAAVQGAEQKAATDQDIDTKRAAFKAAYDAAFDGKTPVTPEQRKKLNAAISDFIRNTTPGGL